MAERMGCGMAPLVDRTEFRKVVREMVKCLRENLDRPGLAPLTADQIMFWMRNVTLEDLEIVLRQIDTGEDSRVR
jgi:hypothetical protein